MEPALMRRIALMALFCTSVFYAPMPLVAQNGGGETPLIPVADMPTDSGGATAPSEPPLEVDPNAVPQLAPPSEVGGGVEAPTSAPAPVAAPEPEPAPAPVEPQARAAVPEPAPSVTPPPTAPPAESAQDEPGEDEEPAPDDEPSEQESDEEDEEEFEEEFEDGPAPGEPQDPGVTPGAEPAGPQLPRTGGDLPALLLSGLALAAAGISLRALVGPPAPRPARPARKLPSPHAHARALRPSLGPDFGERAYWRLPPRLG
jgi:hypothetical protein